MSHHSTIAAGAAAVVAAHVVVVVVDDAAQKIAWRREGILAGTLPVLGLGFARQGPCFGGYLQCYHCYSRRPDDSLPVHDAAAVSEIAALPLTTNTSMILKLAAERSFYSGCQTLEPNCKIERNAQTLLILPPMVGAGGDCGCCISPVQGSGWH